MAIKLGILMDPISNIKVAKDTSFAMLLEAQRRGWSLFYFGKDDLFMRDAQVLANNHILSVKDDPDDWFQLSANVPLPLDSLDVILVRLDPPFNLDYIYMTHLLDHAEKAGCLVVNKPQSLRDANEKLFISHFPQCIPPTLVSRKVAELKHFVHEFQSVVLKPLDAMGGQSVFRTHQHDENLSVIIETLTRNQQDLIMAQQFIPQVVDSGDKRILLIDGEPVPFGFLRKPPAGEIRANLAAGGSGTVEPLSDRELWICEQLKPVLTTKIPHNQQHQTTNSPTSCSLTTPPKMMMP